MKVLQVKEYNKMDMMKWNKRVELWKEENRNNIIPQIACIGFRQTDGEMKQYGYVAFGDSKAIWKKTKKEAIKAFNQISV